MQGNMAFLMKDVVLLTVSVYLLQQDLALSGLSAGQHAGANGSVKFQE
jgi:hypothetical protein